MKNKRLLKIGLIVFPAALILNILFMKLQMHGILRELSRAGVLVGLLLIVFGSIYALFQKSSNSKQ